MAVIRKELKDLIERFEQLNEAIDHLHIENEWQIDVYVEEIDAQTNEITFYRTANPPLELLKRYLDELLERTRSVKLPESESGRRKALPTLAMELLASHLREAKPDASRHDLAQLAEDLLDPILPKTVIPPLWHQRARDCWPDSTSTRVKST